MKFSRFATLCALVLACQASMSADTPDSVEKNSAHTAEVKPPSIELAKLLATSPFYTHIRNSGTVVMAVRDSSPPFSYNNGKDQFIGYAVEMCENVIKAMREELELPALKVVYVPATPAERMGFIAKEYVDMECGNTSNSKKRQETANFSYSIFLSQSMFVGVKGKTLKKLEDLKGTKVAVSAETIQEAFLKELNEKQNYGITITTYKTLQEAYLAVLNKNSDFVSSADILLLGLKESVKDDENRLTFYDLAYQPNTFGVLLPKKDLAFVEIFNKHLKTLFDSAKAEEIYKKWFLNPIPPKGINYNWPIEKTQELFANPTSEAMLP